MIYLISHEFNNFFPININFNFFTLILHCRKNLNFINNTQVKNLLKSHIFDL